MEKNQSVTEKKMEVKEDEKMASDGLYVYGIAENSDVVESLQLTGINDQPVFSVPCQGFSAVVHKCPLNAYQSDDESVMKRWVLAHQKVVEEVSERCGTVIPFGFDTIIMPDGKKSAEEVLKLWISRESESLHNKMGKIRGKKEYGVQVFCTTAAIVDRVTSGNETIRALQEDVKNASQGRAYMIRQKIEQVLKKGIESEISAITQSSHKKIQAVCSNIKIEKIKKSEIKDSRMLLNYSCLVSPDQYIQLGEVLESLEQDDGLSVRFTGPWPAYSFV